MDRRRLLIVVGAVFLVLVVVFIIYSIVNIRPKTGIEFIVVPDDITVEVGERKLKVNYESAVAFEPGSYDLKLSRGEFATVEKTVEVKEGSLTQVFVYLEPQTEAARAIVSTFTMKQRIERIGGNRVSEGAAEHSKEYPFIDKLPINDKYFTINPCNLETGAGKVTGICILLVIDQPFYREKALKALRDAEIDPSKWEVHFTTSSAAKD